MTKSLDNKNRVAIATLRNCPTKLLTHPVGVCYNIKRSLRRAQIIAETCGKNFIYMIPERLD